MVFGTGTVVLDGASHTAGKDGSTRFSHVAHCGTSLASGRLKWALAHVKGNIE